MCANWSKKGTFLSTTFFRKCDSVKSMTYEILQGGQKKVPFCYTIQRGIKGNIMKQALFIGAVASVLTLNAFAETTSSTVTSRNYVDARDALKQDKLPSKNVTTTIDETEMDVPSIVLYPADGENAGNVGEIGFVNFDVVSAKENEIYSEYEDAEERSAALRNWLVRDARHGGVGEYAINGFALAIAMDLIQQQNANNMVCAGWPDGVAHTDENCWLWNQD